MTGGEAEYTMTYSHYEQVPLHPGGGDDDPRFPGAIGMRA